MDLLILGGTAFLGPEIVDAAKARGWKLTLFNRGRTKADLFPELEKIRGDRDPAKGDGLKALEAEVAKGRRWDGVIDTSGYRPQDVRASASLLAKAARQYVFISTLSVYASQSVPGADESAPLATVEDPESKAVTGETYGALKACCEREAAKAFGERCTNLRPGLIVGPGDPTDRFTYWPVRVARGGKVLLPAPKSARGTQVTFVDVRDCAAFAVKCVADGHGGTFNVSGPAGPLTFREMVDACKACTSAPVEFVPVDEKFLLEEGVAPWMGLPLWLPEDPEYAGAGSVSRARALAAGCTFRPLADTVQATLAWWARERGDAFPFGAKPGAPGLPAAREQELIEAWEARA